MRTKAGEELVLRTIAQHAESLLRTARRYSLCIDDAHDAYQRALEIFVKNADRLEPGRAAPWLHAVVRNEALDLREQRKELVGTDDVDFDDHEATTAMTPEEHVLTFDMLSRSAEALQSLKPQEVRALWLRAQGHSYSDIGAITGWSYTKVNRCLAEGRQSFLRRYSGIETGEECKRWAATLTAIVDGEATAEQLAKVRPHLRNCAGCRATLAALQESTKPIAAVLPVPLLAAAGGGLETLQGFMLRVHDAVAGSLASSSTKVQAVVEASATGKVAAVAASAAAVAGGGYATVEQVKKTPERRPAAERTSNRQATPKTSPTVAATPKPATAMVRTPKSTATRTTKPRALRTATERRGGPSPEFSSPKRVGETPEFMRSARSPDRVSETATSDASTQPDIQTSPEFSGAGSYTSPSTGSADSPEFAP